MAWRLRTLAAFSEDQGSVPNMHYQVVHEFSLWHNFSQKYYFVFCIWKLGIVRLYFVAKLTQIN